MRNSSSLGTGTVVVPEALRFCMMTWLPLLWTSLNPCRSGIRHASVPDMGLSLGNTALHWNDVALALYPALELFLTPAR
jgi:hypothetical protein